MDRTKAPVTDKKRPLALLAMLVALALALAAPLGAPAQAWADETDSSTVEQFPFSIGETGYATLSEAIAAVGDNQTIYVNNDITNAVGLSVPSGKNFTIDFQNHTYTVSDPGAGSTGTETNAFQLLKDSTITMKNGSIKIAEGTKSIKRIIQNYANLTLDGMNIYAANQVGGEAYALSFNYGNVVFKNNTNIVTTSPNTVAFDVYFWNVETYKEGVSVTFDNTYTGSVNGKIVYDSTDESKAALTIEGNGSFGAIEASETSCDAPNIDVSGGTFSEVLPLAYCADGYIPVSSDGKYTVDGGNYNVAILNEDGSCTGYTEQLSRVLYDYVKDGQTVVLLKDWSYSAFKPTVKNSITLDFNGHVLNGSHSSNPTLLVDAEDRQINVEIKNGTVTATQSDAIRVQKNSTVVFDNMTVQGATYGITLGHYDYDAQPTLTINGENTSIYGGTAGIAMYSKKDGTEGAKLTVNAGTVSGGLYGIAGNGTDVNSNDLMSITINGGIVKSTAESEGAGIYHPQRGTLTVAGGKVEGPVGIQMCSGNLVVKGSPTIVATASDNSASKDGDGVISDGAAISVVNRDYPGGAPVVSIGGTPTVTATEGADAVRAYTWNKTDKVQEWANAGDNVNISGGQFSSAVPEAFCAAGYAPTSNLGDGIYGVAVAENVVASVGNVSFSSLAEAFAAANGDAVKLLVDLEGQDLIVIGSNDVTKSVTFDLNGHSVVFNNGAFSVASGSTLTVKDGTDIKADGTGLGKIIGKVKKDSNALFYANGSSIVLESGRIESVSEGGKGAYGIMVSDGGSATVSGGAISTDYAPLAGNNTTGDMNFTVSGGTLTAKYGPAIYMPGQMTLEISGGTLNGGVSLRMGQVSITGGTINAATGDTDDPKAYYNYSGNAWLPDALYVFGGTYASENQANGNSLNLSITGGTFNCENGKGSAVAIYDLAKVAQSADVKVSGNAVLKTNAENRSAYQVLSLADIGVTEPAAGYGSSDFVEKVATAISGGQFSSQVDDKYCADGYASSLTTNSEGLYVVEEKPVAKLQSGEKVQTFDTLQGAVTAATKAGDVVTLLQNTTEDITAAAGQDITIDLGGNTLKGKSTSSTKYALTNSGKLALRNGTIEVNGGRALSAKSGSTMDADGLTISGKGTYAVLASGGSVCLKNSSITGTFSSYHVNVQSNGSAVLDNVTATADVDMTGMVKTTKGGVTVKNCTFTANAKAPMFAAGNDAAASISIENGTYINNGTGQMFTMTTGTPLKAASISITGGTFNGGTAAIFPKNDVRLKVSGGTFTSEVPSQNCAEGYLPAKFEKDSKTTYGVSNKVAFEFLGGSLRMDYKNDDGSADYSKTSLRFGYNVTPAEGVVLTGWGWNWGLSEDLEQTARTGEYKADLDNGAFHSNLVVTGVPAASYGTTIYSQIYAQYTDDELGTVTVTEGQAQSRSVSDVATAIGQSDKASNEEKAYAASILGAINTTNQDNA